MASFKKCTLMALIGAVLLTAVLADKTEKPSTSSGISGLGAKLFRTAKDAGASILSHIPFVGHIAHPTNGLPKAAAVEETVAGAVADVRQEATDAVERVVTEATAVKDAVSEAVADNAQEAVSETDVKEKPNEVAQEKPKEAVQEPAAAATQ